MVAVLTVVVIRLDVEGVEVDTEDNDDVEERVVGDVTTVDGGAIEDTVDRLMDDGDVTTVDGGAMDDKVDRVTEVVVLVVTTDGVL